MPASGNFFLIGPLLLNSLIFGNPGPIDAKISDTGQTQLQDTLPGSQHDYRNIRGTEQEEQYPSDMLRYSIDGILYVPRQILSATLYLTAKTGAWLDRPEVREKIENIIYLHKEDIGWHPLCYWTTGYRLKYGARLFAKTGKHTSYALGAWHSQNNWRGKVKLVLGPKRGRWAWKLEAMGLAEKADDWEYYGLGANPENDSRNGIINPSDDDHANFTQTINKAQAVFELVPIRPFSLAYLTYYHMRELEQDGYGSPSLEDVFDIGRITAFNRGRPVEQFYQELSLEWDTRISKKRLFPGYRVSGYGGLSRGTGGDPAKFYRTGFDAGLFIPVIKNNRILVIRGLADKTGTLEDGIEIPFTDYPQNLAYRGTPNRAYLRADNYSFIGSIEYQWPAGPFLNAHLFSDYLAVGRHFDSMGWRYGRTITGLGIDFHFKGKEYGRVEIGAGNEGFRMSASLGVPLETNARSDWN